MADPVVGQKLTFETGVLLVDQSFGSPRGLLHKTTDGGYFYRPGEPLTEQEVADALPEPYKTEATEFIVSQTPPEIPPEGGVLSGDASKTAVPYGRRR